ncbi:MAG: NAD(P)H-dependent oxidoreductase [Candidatus Limnocylindria bacterium]
MRVLTVYAHPNPKSFCHAVMENFTRGLRDAGHTAVVLDLYAIKFDPVFTMADAATWLHPDMPPDVLERWNPRQAVLDGVTNPLKRLVARRAMRGKDDRAIARMIREHGPKDTAEHWRLVAEADAMAFIAPVYWLGFPAILKGWHERVFSYGNAFALDRNGWNGEVRGRIGLLEHEKVLVMSSTLFSQADYEAELEEPMRRVIDDWSLRYPGVKQVEHVYFYRAAVADQATIDGYLARAYRLGTGFAEEGAGREG